MCQTSMVYVSPAYGGALLPLTGLSLEGSLSHDGGQHILPAGNRRLSALSQLPGE